MNNNSWFKKEMPLQTVIGFGGGATGFGAHSSASKTYIDDIFSTYLSRGTGATKTITNGIDLSSEGGLVWQKCRTLTQEHLLIDSERGLTKALRTNAANGEFTASTSITSFNSDGFTQGSYGDSNQVDQDYALYSFRQCEKFFDVLTYTGNASGAGRQISHNLGSVPACIILKKTNASDDWVVYHRGTDDAVPQNEALFLNTTGGVSAGSAYWNNTAPTSTYFTLGNGLNEDGESYVVYLFAGNRSSSDNAVEFDGTDDDVLRTASSSDFAFGTGKFTVEYFVNLDAGTGTWQASVGTRVDNNDNNGDAFSIGISDDRRIILFSDASYIYPTNTIAYGQWHHVAVVREGTGTNETKMYLDGKNIGEGTFSNNLTKDKIGIGNLWGNGSPGSGNEPTDGKISNVRITKGQALYTRNFGQRFWHDPLTTTSQGANPSNVKLLCCNQSTVTGSTVTSATLSVGGSIAASTNNSIFDDTESYFLGDDGDKSGIRCGAYIGNNSTTGPKIDLGWQPQWLLIKRVGGSGNDWNITDTMRGFTSSGGDDIYFRANENIAELDISNDSLAINSTGFSINSTSDNFNASGKRYIYIAIRGSDGAVSAVPSAGTAAFALDTGNGSATIPAFDSTFPVDFALSRIPGSSDNWYTQARLTALEALSTNQNWSGSDVADFVDDSNVGWMKDRNSNYQSWMWKRGQGFDTVAYSGDSNAGRVIEHSMNQAPEMIWIKNRTDSGNTGDWMVGHKDLNAGSSPWNYYLVLNKMQAEYSDSNPFNNSAPTSTSFQLDSWDRVNASGSNYLAMLFSSVTGISKVGSYTGTDSDPGPTITTGFQPRFIMIKARNQSGNWVVLDSLRGINAGADTYSWLNLQTAQENTLNIVDVSSTGFTIKAAYSDTNVYQYIYYAHA